MDFSAALQAIKDGKRVTRDGWNGKGMYVYFVPANAYAAQTDVARAEFGDMVPYRAYMALKTAQNDVAPWSASNTDILAEDWVVLE